MLSLWRIRSHRAHNPLPDVRIVNRKRAISDQVIERAVPTDAIDRGEHVGIITPDENGLILGRLMAGPLIQLALDREFDSLKGVRWGIVWARSGDGEYSLPDSFGSHLIMPLSPVCCLVGNEDHGTVGQDGITQINRIAQANSVKYLAARDFDACPGTVLPTQKAGAKLR